MRSSSAGSKSAATSAALRCWSASSSALIAISIAFTAGSTSAGELAARRSRRRTAAASAGTGEWGPPTASCASRRSLAIFSPCIMVVRRPASAVSSPSFGFSVFEFVGGVAQIVRLARGALHAGAMRVERGVGGAPRLPQRLQRRDLLLQPGKGVEQLPVRRGIDQRALVMLAVDLDQRRADGFQGLHADRLVVDEGAGAAVGELHAAQNHLAGVVEAVLGQDLCRRMALGDVEGRRHLALLRAMADQARHRRGRRAPARRHRAGWICPRRSRRSAPRGHGRIRYRAVRSGRCHGSTDAPACEVNS